MGKVRLKPSSNRAATGIHNTAIGKLLLAFKPDDFIREFLDQSKLTRYTPRTIVDPGSLWEQIREIRQQCYAINDGEQYDGVGAVGVPVHDSRGRVSLAVSLAYPRHLIYGKSLRLNELISLANEVAREIEMRIGSAPFKDSEDHEYFHRSGRGMRQRFRNLE